MTKGLESMYPAIAFLHCSRILSIREAKPKLKAWQDRVHYRMFQNLTFKGQKGRKKAMKLTFRPLTKFFIANSETLCKVLQEFENIF